MGTERQPVQVSADEEAWQKEVAQDEEARVPVVEDPPSAGSDDDNADE